MAVFSSGNCYNLDSTSHMNDLCFEGWFLLKFLFLNRTVRPRFHITPFTKKENSIQNKQLHNLMVYRWEYPYLFMIFNKELGCWIILITLLTYPVDLKVFLKAFLKWDCMTLLIHTSYWANFDAARKNGLKLCFSSQIAGCTWTVVDPIIDSSPN